MRIVKYVESCWSVHEHLGASNVATSDFNCHCSHAILVGLYLCFLCLEVRSNHAHLTSKLIYGFHTLVDYLTNLHKPCNPATPECVILTETFFPGLRRYQPLLPPPINFKLRFPRCAKHLIYHRLAFPFMPKISLVIDMTATEDLQTDIKEAPPEPRVYFVDTFARRCSLPFDECSSLEVSR
jgi:hypothetical protein